MTPNDIWFGQNNRAGSGHTHGWGFSIKPRAPFFRPSAAVPSCGAHGSSQAIMAATLLCFRKSTLVFTAPQFAHSKLWTARSARTGCGLIMPGFKGLRHFGHTSFIKRSKDRVSLLNDGRYGEGVKLDPSTLSLINAAEPACRQAPLEHLSLLGCCFGGRARGLFSIFPKHIGFLHGGIGGGSAGPRWRHADP